MQSVMKHDFSDVVNQKIPRSVFNRTHGYKSTFDSGWLIPFYTDEVLPSDSFAVDASFFARLNTLLTPIMDNLYMDIFWFFVPNRLLWENWQKFCGEQINPGDSIDYTIPQIVAPATVGFAEGSLEDYFGLPVGVPDISVSALYHRAYNLIYNEWFRDQNLTTSIAHNTGNGPDTATDYIVRLRGKRHDYFTSCLPWPQKGTDIELPLVGDAPVLGIGKHNQNWNDTNTTVYETGQSSSSIFASASQINPSASADYGFSVEQDGSTGYPNIRADLSAVSAATINDLREAISLQHMLEIDSRSGTRYREILRSHFGIESDDARLQRPELLGGGTINVDIQTVPQSSEAGTTPQATLAGFGTISGKSGFSKSFSEHGILMGILNVRADITYQNGIGREFSRLTRYDYYYPSMANLGEQAVLNKEIYAQGTADDDNVFGYQEAWAEYRYKPSRITNILRSDSPTSLDVWHLSQDFTALPALNHSFIIDQPPVDRVIATPAEPQFLLDSFIKVKSVRPIPTYSVPGLRRL